MRKIFLMIAIYGLIMNTSCSFEEKTPTSQRLIFNEDGWSLLSNSKFGQQRPLSLADIHAYVDYYAQTSITTFMMCSGNHNLYYRSAYAPIMGENPTNEPTDGKFDFFGNTGKYYQNFLNVEREGVDVLTAVLQRAKEHHLETFLSYRMNDLHFNTPESTPLGTCDFWRSHPEYRIGEDIGWQSAGAFDFAHPEVRKFKTDIITEQLDKYGHLMDGFDLDFLRFPFYFKINEGLNNAPLMTNLVQTVKQKIDEIAKRTGRNIMLSVRVPYNVDFCLQRGLDVKEWARQGLVDMITIGAYHEDHPALPVATFRRDLGNDRIPIYASMEYIIYDGGDRISHGQRRGMAAHAYAQGAAGLYLFNHQLAMDNDLPPVGLSCRTIYPMLNELNSPEKLRKRNKIFALDDGTQAPRWYHFPSDTHLPMILNKKVDRLLLYVADNVREDLPQEAILFVRTDRPELLTVSVNETELIEQLPEYVDLMDRGNNLRESDTVYAFRIPVSVLNQGYNRISFVRTAGTVIIKRIEIALKYGDVTTNGYF